MNEEQKERFRKKFSDLFSGYRAEWLGPEIFKLFTEPSYFPQLTTSHPCFIMGGRGTGKTTVLRSLSYQGQSALHGSDPNFGRHWPFVGMYYRINTNRVRAFSGPELTENTWSRLFAHYLNLEFTDLVLKFLDWYNVYNPDATKLSDELFKKLSVSLHLNNGEDQVGVIKKLELSRLEFEATINNIADSTHPPLSVQGGPIDLLLSAVKELPQFIDTSFFFLIDEYENLDDYQQRVMNTLIKHCGELYSFKVSIRELGLTQRSTLNEHEQLVHPADYKLINITDELEGRFGDFASMVCERRLDSVLEQDQHRPKIEKYFPELSADDEASKLGVAGIIEHQIKKLSKDNSFKQNDLERLKQFSPLEIYTLMCRAKAENKTILQKFSEAKKDISKWKEQYDNYKYSYLFSIRRNKRGIRKYYTGWRVYTQLAACNIRYLLELVDQAIINHLDSGEDPLKPVSPDIQTKAAQITGQKNLRELEGLSLSGAKLTRLLLSIGRVFQVMAEDPVGHTPEVNQFHLSTYVYSPDLHNKVTNLLREGIMHLALLRYPGSKLQEQTDIRQFDYAIHPIFAPFFGFSHRRKRKIELSDNDIWNLVDNPSETIRGILKRQNRSFEEELPEQMKLFAEYYALQDR